MAAHQAPRPWDSPGKNTGMGFHFLLQYMKVKSESEVAQSCPTLSDPMDCSLPGSSIHGFSRQEYWSGVPLASPDIILPKVKLATRDPMMVFIIKVKNSPLHLFHFKKYMYLNN